MSKPPRRGRATRLYARRNYRPEKVAEAIVKAVLHKRAMVPGHARGPGGPPAWPALAPAVARAAARQGITGGRRSKRTS